VGAVARRADKSNQIDVDESWIGSTVWVGNISKSKAVDKIVAGAQNRRGEGKTR
jgi:hypothetical protein